MNTHVIEEKEAEIGIPLWLAKEMYGILYSALLWQWEPGEKEYYELVSHRPLTDKEIEHGLTLESQAREVWERAEAERGAV